MNYLALVIGYSKVIESERYYKYDSIKFYKLRKKNDLIKLIEEGKVYVEFSLEKEINNKTSFMVHRGSVFKIKRDNIDELFEEIDIKKLN